MIYSDRFVWLHFPKCAGSKIERLFAKYFSQHDAVIQDPVGVKKDPTIAWHDSIALREKRDPGFILGERDIICSFRRLASWLESRYCFEVSRSPYLEHRPELLLEGRFLHQNGKIGHADVVIQRYLPPQILKSNRVRFIRKESFKIDFNRVFGDYLDLSNIPDSEYNEYVNSSKRCLPQEFREKMYSSIPKLYEKCPYWHMLEEKVYGI